MRDETNMTQDRPEPFGVCSTRDLWTDPHVSGQMLALHLDPAVDAASRRPDLIERSVAWMAGHFQLGPGSAVLDLGCGPGLYAIELARAGHRLTGCDISERSIAYAREQAARAGLALDYRCLNYLDLAEVAAYDLVMMIYCDLGALTAAQRQEMLARMRRALRPGGLLVFDVCGADLGEVSPDRRSWSWQESGFWSAKPHLLLEENVHHPERRVVARRFTVIDAQTNEARVHFLRDYYFDPAGLRAELQAAGFKNITVNEDLIRPDVFIKSSVLFVAAQS
jgi:SAM-dependent methyltransferase